MEAQVKRLPRREISYYGKEGKTLGEGVSGLVKIAEGPNGSFALKVIKQDGDNGYNTYALREIAVLIKSNHPNVVNLIDVTDRVGSLTEIYPLAKGDLASFLPKLKGQEASICYQMAKGIAYLAAMDVWHRDIKPYNMLVFEDVPGIYRVVIADLGLARSGTCIAADDPYTEEVITLPYRAPEILLGGRFRTVSDVWSFGITCIEVITGKRFINLDTEDDVLYRIFGLYGRVPTNDDWLGVTMMPRWNSLKQDYLHGRTIEEYLIGYDKLAITYVKRVLVLDPNKRPMIYNLQSDPWFDTINNNVRQTVSTQPIKASSCTEYTVQHAGGLRKPPPFLTSKMTPILYTWLMDVTKEYNLSVKTLSRGLVILELYLGLPEFQRELNADLFRSSYQLFGSAALALASDIHEVYSPKIADWIYIADYAFNREKFQLIYNTIVQALDFDLYVTSPSDALRAQYREYSGDIKSTAEVFCLLGEITGMAYMYDHPTIALGSLVLACAAKHEPFKHEMKKELYGGYIQALATNTSKLILSLGPGEVPEAFKAVGYEFWETLGLLPSFITLLDPQIPVPQSEAPVEDLTALLTKLSIETKSKTPSNAKENTNAIIDLTKDKVAVEATSFVDPSPPIVSVPKQKSKDVFKKPFTKPFKSKSKAPTMEYRPKVQANTLPNNSKPSANNTNAPTRLTAKK
jgi:cyclin-dependent kinase